MAACPLTEKLRAAHRYGRLRDTVFVRCTDQSRALQSAAGSTNIRVGSTIFGKRDYIGSKPSDPNEQETQQAEQSLQT